MRIARRSLCFVVVAITGVGSNTFSKSCWGSARPFTNVKRLGDEPNVKRFGDGELDDNGDLDGDGSGSINA